MSIHRKNVINEVKQELKSSLIEEIEKLETPINHVACDYADHIDKDEVIDIISKK